MSFDFSFTSPRIRRFRELIAPKTDRELESLAANSHAITLQYFGRVMRLFAPLYLSNECINSCQYCGFSRQNPILRVTLEVEQVLREARHLVAEGFRNILLVAGEHPKFVSHDYLQRCVARLAPEVPGIALEVAPMERDEYEPLVAAGAEALVVYQETYHRPTYARMHTAGPKKDFDWRLACPERAYDAGFRRIGIGALFGLWDWREEAVALAAHLEHLLKKCWKANFTVSLPRLRPAAGDFEPPSPLPDRDLIQLICAMRICFPQVGLVLSTREPAALRDTLIPLGITMMSAGSHTEPGGYTGEGKENLHRTVGGRQQKAENVTEGATGQFEIADHRSPREFATQLRRQGFEPVWKDWDSGILSR
jgi:2-iminoacetate synthase